MNRYNLEARLIIQHDLRQLDDELIDSLWGIFVKIGEVWESGIDPAPMRSNFLVFISNRLEIDYNYLAEYINAREVIDELRAELGDEKAYRKLFTDPLANINPPVSRIARVRQRVSNEFAALWLALGGFKVFGSPLNYPGYIGGANLEGATPYRTYPPKA